MNPLGYPFEIYDDFGRFRVKEKLEHPDNVVGKEKGKYGSTKDLYKKICIFELSKMTCIALICFGCV